MRVSNLFSRLFCLFLLLPILLISTGCSDEDAAGAGSTTQVVWTKTFGDNVKNEGWSVAVAPSGDVFVSGFYNTASGSDGIQLLKYNSAGTLLSNRVDTTVAQAGVKIVCAQDGSVYVAYHDNTGDQSTHIRKYGSELNFQWDQTLDSGTYNEAVHDMVIEGDLLYVVGTINGNANGYTGSDYYDLMVACYNLSTKSWEWKTILDGSDSDSNWDYGAGITIDSTYVYVTGETDGDLGGISNNSKTPFIGKFTKSGGIKQWIVIHQDAGGKDIAIDNTGNIFVTGAVGVAKFDGSGNFLNKKTVIGESGETESGNAIAYTMAGTLIITGEIGDGNTTYAQTIDAYIGIFNTGADSVLWSNLYGEPSLDNGAPAMAARDEGHDIAVGTDGSVYVVGNTASVTFNGVTNPGGSGNYDIFLMKLLIK